jgi:hypothetical protein
MPSGHDDAVRPDPDPPPVGGSGTVRQHTDQGPSGTFKQPDRQAAAATVTFLRGSAGPLPQVHTREELTQLIVRSKEGIEPPLVAGYTLVRELGSGAYGTVWEGQNADTKERVAIKFFLASRENTGTVLEEVTNLRDAEGCYGIISVKQVNRHGIAPHYVPNYVMSLEVGGSLQKRIDAGTLTPDRAVRLFAQLARAMAFVHSRGLLHCDLKPANVLLNAAEEPVVADFGQAQRASSTVAALGTFFYMAPEQATRQPRTPSTQSDVYSLGAILYTMLVGKPPRHDERFLAKLRGMADVDDTLEAYRVGLKDLPPPTAHKGVADPLLAQLIDRCLDLDPDKRPDDAGDLLRHLKHRDWWNRTRPVVTLGTAATAVGILILLTLSLWAGDVVLANSRRDITREIQGSLLRDSWFGRKETEDRFDERIRFMEETAHACPADLREQLARLAKKVAAPAFKPADLTEADRRPFDAWLTACHKDLLVREGKTGWKSISLLLAAPGRGYFVSRVDTGGEVTTRTGADGATVYGTNWAFRDYFGGGGNDYPKRGRTDLAHAPIHQTHITQAYQSTADNRPWRVDVATPIFARESGTDREVVAVLVTGFDQKNDLRPWIEADDDTFPPSMAIASQVNSVLINDRGSWVWHEGAMAKLEADLAAGGLPRDPERYLVGPWNAPRLPTVEGDPDPLPPLDRSGDPEMRLRLSDRHRDSWQDEPGPAAKRYIAAYEVLLPYKNSRFPQLREKPWYLVVKLDAATALRPVEELKQKMQWAGLVLFAGLLALTVALWVWLIRLLRRQEFATNG